VRCERGRGKWIGWQFCKFRVLADVQVIPRYKHDLVVKIREGKEKPEWLREDFWNELAEHIDQKDVKAKSKFMSGIAGGRASADGPAPITAITIGAELIRHSFIGTDVHGNFIIY
jgi:hypothetical protein